MSLEYDELLFLAKNAAQDAVKALAEINIGTPNYSYSKETPREMKAKADVLLEGLILNQLKSTGIPILSEEAGELHGAGDLKWIVDPLDGTVNYMRGLAPCAVSIALYLGDSPIFGVIGEYPSGKLAWGGCSFGSFIDEHPIQVSAIQIKNQAVICTGFPSRFDFTDAATVDFIGLVSPFGKVRMLGAASLSLLQVAKGSADAYAEQDIMIWDVAAGLALIEGAGGSVTILPGRYQYSHNVFATNGLFQLN